MPSKKQNNEIIDVLKGILVALKDIADHIDELVERIKNIDNILGEMYTNIKEYMDYSVDSNSSIKAVLEQIDKDLVSLRKMLWVEYNEKGRNRQYGYKTRRRYRRYYNK